ncbi:hypothetical protein Taro_022021 [Colocasia esculenta]|uniref:Uncharacterized protein n=1 Tax=Colocasia esculenta TaxID=4460 RepID=A0A843V0Q3_COLES|nr:hypothetical protein [Colocasia esculenta]
MAGAASVAVEDEWELCNDDGFIYKRRKRAQPDQGIPFASSSAQPHAADPETELKRNWLARRKLSLTSLRDRYCREIQQWEVLVASLQDGGRGGSDSYAGVGGGCDLLHLATEEKAGQDGAATGAASMTCDHQESDGILPPENPFHALVEELMSQVGARLVFVVLFPFS